MTETRGQPDGMVVCHLPYGPTAYFTLCNAVMRHDVPDRQAVSEQYPHLIFNNLNTKLGQRVCFFKIKNEAFLVYQHFKISISCTQEQFQAGDHVREQR